MSNNSNGIRGVRVETVGPPERLSEFSDAQLYRLMVEKAPRDVQLIEQRAQQLEEVIRGAIDEDLYLRAGYECLEDYVAQVIGRDWDWIEAVLLIAKESREGER